MSESESETPTQEEIEAKREELLDDTRNARQKHEEQHNELLDAVASDDEIADYDTAEFGTVRVRHKSWLPGDEVERLQKAMQSEGQNKDDELSLLVNLTEDVTHAESGTTYTEETDIRLFWKDYLSKYGTDGYAAVMNRLLAPIMEQTREKMEAMQSFQGAEPGDNPRSGNAHDGFNPE